MKTLPPILIALLVVILAMLLGLGDALYAGLALIGLITLAVGGAVVWTIFDKKKAEANRQKESVTESKKAD